MIKNPGEGIDVSGPRSAASVSRASPMRRIQPVRPLGNQQLTGNSADNLSGRPPFDMLGGGDGNDTLIGGGGQDRMTGGNGADTFIFTSLADSVNDTYRADGGKFLPTSSSIFDR